MDSKPHFALLTALVASATLAYIAKPTHAGIAAPSAATTEIRQQESVAATLQSAVTTADTCYDDNVKEISCNDLLIEQAVTGHAMP